MSQLSDIGVHICVAVVAAAVAISPNGIVRVSFLSSFDMSIAEQRSHPRNFPFDGFFFV